MGELKRVITDRRAIELIAEAVVRTMGGDVDAHRARREAAKAAHAAKFAGGKHV